MAAGFWRIAAASVAGTSHAATGMPCQDAYALVPADPDGRILAVAVSDGAGSAPLSADGAAIASDTLAGLMALHATQADAAGIADDAARGWYAAARGEIEAAAARSGRRARDYACTLLGALVDEGGGLFLQVGDGAIAVRLAGSAAWTAVTWPQHGEYANETNFVVGRRSGDDLVCVRIEGEIEEVALFTDGLENLVLDKAARTAHAPFFDHVAAPVRRLGAKGPDATLSRHLAAYLSSADVASRTDDDVTLVVASRGTGP